MTSINNFLSQFKVPHTMNRKFPQFKPNNIKLKSSELKQFIFHLSLPLLINILPNTYWSLLFIYVFATRTLYEPTTKSDTDLAEEMIKVYHENLGENFGPNSYTYTIHAHLHLARQVRLHGPLQCNSEFVFEVKSTKLAVL